MTNVTITITSTAKFSAPPGTNPGAFRFRLVQGPATLDADSDSLVGVITSVPPGDWTPSAFRMDVNGSQIGPAFTGTTFNIPAPGVAVDVPAAISVTVS